MNQPLSGNSAAVKQRFPKIAISNFSTSLNGFTTIMNVMLGTGPLIVPPVFLAAGVGLSSIFMSFVIFMSYLGAQYVCEGMSITNALKRIEEQGQNSGQASMQNIDGKTANKTQSNYSVKSFVSQLPEDVQQEMRTRTDLFSLQEVCQYGQIGYYVFGNIGLWTCSIIIMCYLYCGLISQMIITGNISSGLFGHVEVLDNYFFWMLLFFTSCAILSFRDMASIKILQLVIATTRFLSIFLMLLGAFIQMGKTGSQSLTPPGYPAFNFDNFNSLFSNVVFAFLMHHSIPGMVSSVRPQGQIKQVFLSGYLSAFVVMFMVSITGILAFGTNLIGSKGSGIKYYNLDFKDDEPFIYYFVSCYMLFNIAAIPVMCITLRNGMMKLFIPDKLPQTSFEITKESFIFTIIILGPVLLCSILFRNNIQTVLHFTSSVFGTLLLLTIPCLMVIIGRRQIRAILGNYLNPIHTSFIQNDIIAYVMLVISLFFFVYSTYTSIAELFK